MNDFRRYITILFVQWISLTLIISQAAPMYANDETGAFFEDESAELVGDASEDIMEEDVEFDEENMEEDEEIIEEEIVEEEEATPEQIEKSERLEKALHAAKTKLDAARITKDNAQEQIQKGSIGFFESVGATTAISKIQDAKYANYTNVGDGSDATSLNNMKESLDFIRECNSYRVLEGQQPLLVNHEMMAISQSNTNASKVLDNHSFQYSVSENLAWYYVDPFDGWYTEEKMVYDYKKAHPEATAQEIAKALNLFSTSRVQTGHYLNIIDSRYKSTGFAVSVDKYGRKTFGQVFTRNTTGSYTIDAYESMFMQYYNSLYNADAEYTNALNAYNKALAAYNNERVYSIYFDGNGGVSSRDFMYMVRGEMYESLPVATKDNCIFIGWQKENGEFVDENTVFDQDEDMTLIAVYQDGLVGTPIVDEDNQSVKSISLDKTEVTLYSGDTVTITPTINPESAIGYTLTWSSSDASVASVEKGKVSAHKEGSATITVTSDNGVSASCVVKVNKRESKLAGYSLSLDGDVSLNFFMTLSNEDARSSKMNFYMDGNLIETINTEKARKNGDYYVYACHVSAKNMSNEITAEFVGEQTKQYKKSVEGYANTIIQNASQYDVHCVGIVKAMLTYGRYVQLYFDYKENNCPNYVNVLQDVDLSWVDTQFIPTIEGNLPITFAGARLKLTSKLELKLYFIGEVESVKVNGQTRQLETEGKYKVLTISDINNPAEMYTISTNCFTLKYGVYSYAQKSLETSNEKLNNMIKALVAFNNAIHL